MRNEKHETVADIVKEMRERAEAMEIHGRPNGIKVAMKEFANRVEVAAKREREARADVAKLREALEKAKKAICHHAKYICQSLSCENSNIQSNCADVLCAHRELCEAKTVINSALEKPPRNCDVFDTKNKAREAFQKLRGHSILADVSLWDDRNEIEEFFNWLFAEAKGETK